MLPLFALIGIGVLAIALTQKKKAESPEERKAAFALLYNTLIAYMKNGNRLPADQQKTAGALASKFGMRKTAAAVAVFAPLPKDEAWPGTNTSVYSTIALAAVPAKQLPATAAPAAAAPKISQPSLSTALIMPQLLTYLTSYAKGTLSGTQKATAIALATKAGLTKTATALLAGIPLPKDEAWPGTDTSVFSTATLAAQGKPTPTAPPVKKPVVVAQKTAPPPRKW